MLYIKINDNKYSAKFQAFTTQLGNKAIRVISEAPLAEDGFLIVDDKDSVIKDNSNFKYLYREDEKCKEYTSVEETIIPTIDYEMSDIPTSSIQRQINSLNKRVTNITPYKQTKKGYYGEIEKMFYGVPQGDLSIFFTNYAGEYTISRTADRVRIGFPERLTGMTDITIMVQ